MHTDATGESEAWAFIRDTIAAFKLPRKSRPTKPAGYGGGNSDSKLIVPLMPATGFCQTHGYTALEPLNLAFGGEVRTTEAVMAQIWMLVLTLAVGAAIGTTVRPGMPEIAIAAVAICGAAALYRKLATSLGDRNRSVRTLG